MSECRNAGALRAHQGVSEPEEKDNGVILTLAEAFS